MTANKKKVRMKLVGLNGNAFSLLGTFVAKAKEQGWTPDESDAVVKEATSGDYDHLLRTLASHVTGSNSRKGFTLIELMVVMSITSILLLAVLWFGPRWWGDFWLSKGTAGVQAAIIDAQSAAAAGYRGKAERVVGVRFLPDPFWPVVKRPDGTIDPTAPIAYARTVPLVEPGPYSSGRASIHTDGFPAGFTPPSGVLTLEESPVDAYGVRSDPTTWWWLIRVGDVVTIQSRTYTVVGPTLIPAGPNNPDGCVNWGWPGQVASPLDRGATGTVDLVFDEFRRASAPSPYGRPAVLPMQTKRLHFWVEQRSAVLADPDRDVPAKVITLDLASGRTTVADADPLDVAGTIAGLGR
jgi:prepilin-type N-terminal cleavage/methylation domain-containing protein